MKATNICADDRRCQTHQPAVHSGSGRRVVLAAGNHSVGLGRVRASGSRRAGVARAGLSRGHCGDIGSSGGDESVMESRRIVPDPRGGSRPGPGTAMNRAAVPGHLRDGPALTMYHYVSSGLVTGGDHRAGRARPAGLARLRGVINSWLEETSFRAALTASATAPPERL